MKNDIDGALDTKNSSFHLLLALILSIIAMLIFIAYNVVKYNTDTEVSAVKDADVGFSSASVLVSKPMYANSNTLIKYKSICVLSSETGMSDEQAIKAALGNAKAYRGYSNYRVDVVRPCKSYQDI